MDIILYKYQGAGNDFIIIDNRKKVFPTIDRENLIKKLCHRKFGIGSDGLMLLENDNIHDFYMEFYNPDGSQSFCGNGSRCIVMFASHLAVPIKTNSFKSIHGITNFEILNSQNVKIQMFDVDNVEVRNEDYIINTGSPHYISFVNDVNNFDLIPFAKNIRYNSEFKANGININIISETPNGIAIRTYERGVEDETWACGTGASACAMAFASKTNQSNIKSLDVITKGGQLNVEFDSKENNKFQNVFLSGPAVFVFKGEVNV